MDQRISPSRSTSYRQVALDLAWEHSSEAPLRLLVAGTSMRPLLRRGDTIVVARALPAELRPGDVVVARRQQGLVTHRLLAADARGWHLKGDALLAPDQPFQAEALLGLVLAVERDGRTIDLRRPISLLVGRLLGYLGRTSMLGVALLRALRGRARD